MGRLVHLSGVLTQMGSLLACLWGSTVMLAICLALMFVCQSKSRGGNLPSPLQSRTSAIVGKFRRLAKYRLTNWPAST